MKAHQIVSQIIRECSERVKIGVTPIEIDAFAEQRLNQLGGTSYLKGYQPGWAKVPFPNVMAISVNNIITHGIPDDTPFQFGDVVNLDCGVIDVDGNCGDCALSIGVGELAQKDQNLLKYAKRILYEAIDEVRAGINTMDITLKIMNSANKYHYRVNKRFGGHTIGKKMHMKPNIYNVAGDWCMWDTLKEGQIICIEPMITYSRDDMGTTDETGWLAMTRDGKNSAMFEHMILVTKNGYEVLTDHISM